MRILVLGGYGLLGAHVAAHLFESGHEIVGLTRSSDAVRRYPSIQWRHGDMARMKAPSDWIPLLDGIGAIVNCAGALQDSARESLQAVHVDAPRALYQAAAARGIRRVIHISSAGIQHADTYFAQTKREAEAMVTAIDLDWAILRPGLLIAPNAFGGTALIRALAGFPFAIPVPKSAALMQSVSVKDVAQTVGFLLKADAPVQVTWDLVHPDRMTFQEIVRAHRRWLGFKGDRIIPVPLVVARGVAGISDFLGYLGWRSSFRTTALKQLLSGVDGRPEDWMRTSGIAPRSLDQILAAQPAGLQDRWFARAFFLKPLGLALDVFLWGFSGVAVLTDSFHPPSVLDSENLIAVWSLILAFLLLVRSTVRPALIAAIITSLVFFLTPQGSFNNLAVIFMHLTLLALLDER